MADKAPALAVGIDLGTTNCALAALDRATGAAQHETAAWPVPFAVSRSPKAPARSMPSEAETKSPRLALVRLRRACESFA